MSENLILWGVGTSRTARTHWAMHELGLEYQCRAILPRSGETKTAEYTKLNARQKIPLLQDGSFTIGESAAIVAYLSRTYSTPEKSLVPDDPAEFARWMEWCFFIIAELDSTSLYVMRRHGTKQGLAHIYGPAPEVVDRAGEYFKHQLRHVEVSLDDGRRYLGLPDKGPFTLGAIDYGIEVCDNAVPYLERVTSRLAFRESAVVNAANI